MNCVLCRIDAAATDEQTYRAFYFVIGGKMVHVDPSMCEDHARSIAFATKALTPLTSGEIQRILDNPPDDAPRARHLRIVPPGGASHE